MIYTDLTDAGNGKVQYKRSPETFFVSGAEALFMATCQLERPYKTNSSGTFGSQFVTAIVSGDSEQNISISCYQVRHALTIFVGICHCRILSKSRIG